MFFDRHSLSGQFGHVGIAETKLVMHGFWYGLDTYPLTRLVREHHALLFATQLTA